MGFRRSDEQQTSLSLGAPTAKVYKSLLPSAPQRVAAAPYFVLEPNPFLGDLAQTAPATVGPAAGFPEGLSTGKNTYVYDAHSYHTKVPPEGIERLVEHFTRPGEVVLDPFCGSGMTGVAALRRNRVAILSDLSPAAAFIAYNNCTPIAAHAYTNAVEQVLALSSELENELYGVRSGPGEPMTLTNYVVWSFGTVCPTCDEEFVLWDAAKDERESVRESKIRTRFSCPSCETMLSKRELKKKRRHPVRIVYFDPTSPGGMTFRSPTAADVAQLEGIEAAGVPDHLWYPSTAIPDGVNTRQPLAAGITSIDKAYTIRGLRALAHLWDICSRWPDSAVRLKLLYTLTSLYKRITVFAEFRFWGGSGNTHHLNVPWVMKELNVFQAFRNKAATIALYFQDVTTAFAREALRVSVQSATGLPQLPDGSVDYVFTDPPFGGNINYSEMNIIWESWLARLTDNRHEAIVNRVQGKGIEDYQAILTSAFGEIRRVLKDSGWMTVVFHNSSAEVWQSLQSAIAAAGWSIEGSQVLDKQHGTFKQFVSYNAVGYDLMLHCRKAPGVALTEVADTSAEEVARSVSAFVAKRIGADPESYRVRYRHVARADEVDFRRLYSEWIQETLGHGGVGLGFEGFRAVAQGALEAA